jgi:Na+/H+-dicarboxylate symporter
MNNPALLSIVYKDEPIIQKTTIGADDVIEQDHKEVSLGEFITSAIPKNIFTALSQGEILQIIIFFSILTVSIASLNNKGTNNVRATLQDLMAIFGKINDSILSVLPFLSFFIIAYQLRMISVETLHALLSLVLCTIVLMCSLIIVFIAIVVFRSKRPFSVVMNGMGRCIMLAFLSSSTLITSGLIIKVMSEELKFNKTNVQLIVPIGAGLLRFGSLSIYFIATILTAYLFNQTLGFYEYVMLMLFSIFATFVSISANNSVAFYQTLSIVMTPLGLPSSSVQSIMISIDFLLEPLITVSNVLGICALSALYSGCEEESTK